MVGQDTEGFVIKSKSGMTMGRNGWWVSPSEFPGGEEEFREWVHPRLVVEAMEQRGSLAFSETDVRQLPAVKIPARLKDPTDPESGADYLGDPQPIAPEAFQRGPDNISTQQRLTELLQSGYWAGKEMTLADNH